MLYSHHYAFQALEEQSVSEWSRKTQPEGQEAEFLLHLMWSVLLDGGRENGASSLSEAVEVDHC